MDNLTARLRNRLTIYSKQPIINELGEDDFEYTPLKTVWGEILNWGGSNTQTAGNTTTEQTSHRIIIRSNAVKELTDDMFFTHKGIRYDIEYFNPSFKKNDFIEILAKRVEGSLIYGE